jgi:Tfp pilus assembly protein FimT
MQGATLVELMLVVGIIGAFSAMAIANMPRMSLDMRISRAAHSYTSLLREARGRALANRSFVRVVLDEPNYFRLEEMSCPFGATSSGAGGCTGWTVIRSYAFASEELRNVKADVDLTSEYSPRGLLKSGGAGTVKFTASTRNDALKQSVRITAAGWAEKL